MEMPQAWIRDMWPRIRGPRATALGGVAVALIVVLVAIIGGGGPETPTPIAGGTPAPSVPGTDAPSGRPAVGCYQVTDLLPSGLSPVIAPWRGFDEGRRFLAPYEVEGQRVSWCIDPKSPRLPLGYAARVVSPGTYRWEPAVVQSLAAPSIGAATAVTSYNIR